MRTKEEIKAGLANQEFFAEYLPTVRLSDEHCVGAETLIRWRRGTQIVSPMEFIPLVENTWLSGAIAYRVVEIISAELGSWMREHDSVHISINVPPEIIGRGGFVYVVEKCGMMDVVDKLMIEITERGLPDAIAIEGIREMMRSAGPRPLFAFDDLGTNDAGLLVLSRLPADVVKLEKPFADSLLREDWTPQEMAGIAALAQAGKLLIIAEGVETARQVAILKDAGIQMAQGHYFSSPLSAPDFIKYFSEH